MANKSDLHFLVNAEIKKKLKLLALAEDKSINDLVLEFIESGLKLRASANKELIMRIKDDVDAFLSDV